MLGNWTHYSLAMISCTHPQNPAYHSKPNMQVANRICNAFFSVYIISTCLGSLFEAWPFMLIGYRVSEACPMAQSCVFYRDSCILGFSNESLRVYTYCFKLYRGPHQILKQNSYCTMAVRKMEYKAGWKLLSWRSQTNVNLTFFQAVMSLLGKLKHLTSQALLSHSSNR